MNHPTTVEVPSLAERIRAAAEQIHHHDPDPGPDDTLLLRIQAANAVARRLGAHLHPDPDLPDPDLDLFQNRAIERLNLGDLELATLMVGVEDEIQDVRKLF